MDIKQTPEYQKFKKKVEEQLTADNYYVRANMPEVGEYWDELGYDEDGKREWRKSYISQEQALQEGIERLVWDGKEDFDEFVTASDLAPAVVELVRVLIKEIING